MSYSKLCLLMLLSCTLAQPDASDRTSTCLLASRFKTHKKYMYQYTTEGRNGVVGTANLRNGPKVSCQVEIEVPQTCGFILHTRDCTLSEVSLMDPQGQPVYSQAPSSEAFRAAMEKNPLKFTGEQLTGIQLYPEPDEPINIVNMKRGIVSALMVPVVEDEQSRLMSTVHGKCFTDYVVNTRKDIATDVTLSRDLSQCDSFYSRELANSPLALLQKLHRPLSKLITSTQDCSYQFDNKGKHVTSATCREKHIYLPFSHEENGISSVVTQHFSFQSSKRINNRIFDVSPSQRKPLHFEEPDDKAPVQTKDAALSTFRDLVALAGTDRGQERAGLFHKLVSDLRALRNETLSPAVTEMLETSAWLTWQALFQCGTPECTSAIFQAIRTIDEAPLEMDALVYGLSLLANPDAARVRDMLSVAQHKQSKAIMYALANTVKKFHQGDITPEVTDVSMFLKTLLNDCSGETDQASESPPGPGEMSFLVLRVVGVMGGAVQAASPSLVSSVMKCARRTDIPLANQKSAVQAFRLMDITHEIRNLLREVYQDPHSTVEKRIAAYLVLMKNPDQTVVGDIVNSLEDIRDEQLKSFVVSHLKNIQKSNEPKLNKFRDYIDVALKDQQQQTTKIFDATSRNYKIDSPMGSLQSNILFDATNTLPKEVLLETTLKVFDYSYDILEVGVEGTGFEPTIDALFGEEGFFPDSISRAMYWVGDKAQMLQEVVERISPDSDRMKRQVPQELLRELTKGVQKLVDNVRSSPTPEVTAYLRLLGHEIGYMKTSEIRSMLDTLVTYFNVIFRRLPYQSFLKLTSSTENEVFAHYIFMENAFWLPTASGFPLKFSLAGVLAPGAQGGLVFSSGTGRLSCMPSVGLEFITQMGVHVPDYVDAGLEMHTNVYHESSIKARVAVSRNQVKLAIPAPRSNTRLFSVSNKLLSISSGQTQIVPSLLEDQTNSADCQLFFSGLKFCTTVRYSNTTMVDQAPYYPLTGETMAAVEIQPTGEVSEYTATITRETLREGREGRQKVGSLKLQLKAEGDESAEVTASLKYSRNKNTLTTEVVIPDYNVEAGIKVAVSDGGAKPNNLWGVTIDVTNSKIPQLTLVARSRLEMMSNAMLQLQMIIPSLQTDTSVTATLRKDKDVLMNLETFIKLAATSYHQRTALKYDDDKIEVHMKSDLNAELEKLIPNAEDYLRQLQQLVDDVLDQQVAKTDMKLRHIVTKAIEAGNIWLDKLTARFPALENLRNKRGLSNLLVPSLAEKLFLESDNSFRYQFNKEKMAISLPLPMGGRTSEELNMPTTLSLPRIDLPQIGLYIPSKTYPLPSFTIPPSLDFLVPLLGMSALSTKINSNFYNWEGSILGGNNTVDVPNYIAQFKAAAQAPFNLLSYKLEGSGMVSGRGDDNLKYLWTNSFSHSLIETSISFSESVQVTDKLNARANYKMEASSPLGLHASLYYSAQSTSSPDSNEVTGDGTMEGTIMIGPFYANTSYTNSYSLHPVERKGRGESTLRFDAPFIQVQNAIHGVYANSELNLVSKTNGQKGLLEHVATLNYKESQLTLSCSGVVKTKNALLSNKVELGVSRPMTILRIESQADDQTNRAYCLLTGTLDFKGLEVISEGSVVSDGGRGWHKASVLVYGNGLTTSGTNSIQCSPVTLENSFSGAIGSEGASMSCKTKATAEESRGELNFDGKITPTEASLYGVFKGNAYDANTRNNVNVVLDRRALTLSSNNVGTMRQMKTEHSNTLTLTLWTLALRSKTDNFLSEDVYYKQGTKVDIKPLVVTADVTNELKFYEASLNNEGHMRLEPAKFDLTGTIKAAYGEEHSAKHTYEISYENMAGAMKYSTSGNALDAKLSHSCELEFAGLSSKSNCEAQINSKPFRLDGTVRSVVQPFSLTVDSLINSDGEIHLSGKHTGQLYSHSLLRAEPLALVYAHDSRASTTHTLPNGDSSSHVDNKFDGVLTPSNQALTWRVKSKLNNHAYNQDISAYNNQERTGVEFSGAVFTDLVNKLSKEKRSIPEEFSVAGFLKYDKKSDCHIIHIPFIKSFPAAFEWLKSTFVQALETLQQFIYNLNVNQLISDFRAKLDQLPMQVSDFMQEMDLENKVNQVKAKLDYLIGEFSVTMEDLELAMNKLRRKMENEVISIATKIRDLVLMAKNYVKDGQLVEKITNSLSQMENQLYALDEKYEIKESVVKVLSALEDIIRQIDLQKFTESSAAWLQELDLKYGILEKIKEKLSEMKQAIEDFDVKTLLKDVKDFLSTDVSKYVEQLSYKIPLAEIARVFESMNDVVVNWIDEYEIPNKLNAVYFYIRDLISKYDLDDKFKEFMDQILVLMKGFRIRETVQSVVDALNAINFEFVYDKIIQHLHSVTSQVKAIEFKKIIDNLNENISIMLKSVKDFDYGAFVDVTNNKIAEVTNYVNEQIITYETVQKIEAVREFFREIQISVFKYLDKLKNTKVADALKNLKDVIDTTFYNDVKIKVQDIIEDMRQRILDMDIRQEMYIYLQRASESYRNMVAFMSAKISQLIEEISKGVQEKEIFRRLKEAVDGALDELRRAEIQVPTFSVPLTDLVVSTFTINLNKLQEISIPNEISIPQITILGSITVPAFRMSFDEIKAKLVAVLGKMREYKIQTIDPEDIFGDLKVLYLFTLPDVTFPEIRLSEIKFPAISIPKLDLNDFKITKLPIPEITWPEIPHDICIPVFGKLHGEFRVVSPVYTLVTTGKIENSTSALKNPQFTATIASQATSSVEPLDFTFEASAQLQAPRMKKLLFRETVKALHTVFSVDHEASLTLMASSAEASARTAAKATSQMYTADLVNSVALTLKDRISATMNSTYNHNLDIPSKDISSQASMNQDVAAIVESGRISLSGETNGNGKWSIQDHSEEGSHKSNVEFNVSFNTAKLTFVGETNSKSLNSKQTLTAEAVILSHVTVEARCETEALFAEKSVLVLNGEAHVGDLKVGLTAYHDAELSGGMTGTVSNSLEFLAHPFEVVFDAKNKANVKMFFPLKLTGKVDLQHDYSLVLNSERQQTCWFALARFNQYKYNHNLTAENSGMDIFLYALANGEANLDFLTVPLSIPEMPIPYLDLRTPEVLDLSLWDQAGFKTLLTTPQQTFDMNLKLQYYKNPDVHGFELYLEPFYNTISDNAKIIQETFEQYRDRATELLKTSYNQAKSQYLKHKINTSSLPPRIFTVPGYKIPVLNIEVSAFRAEMPAFSYFVPKEVSTPGFRVPALGFSVPSYILVLPSLQLPVIHIPETLSEIKLPSFTLPDIQNNIAIPALGNITCDFSFKSSLITLSANAGLYNQSDIIARFGASSASVFDIFNGKIDGTTSVTRNRGIKLASTVSLQHQNMEANHECAVSLTKRSMEASLGNTARISLSFLTLELSQELSGNSKTKPNFSSKKKMKYTFNIPLIESVGKGNFETNWAMEALSSYVSLESSTQGKSDITIMDTYNFAEDLKHDANFYLNANGLRSTVMTALNSNIDKQETQKRSLSDNVLHFDMNENFALEMSLRRVFATLDYSSHNNVNFVSVITNGKHTLKGELDFVPLTTLKSTLSIDASQPNNFGHAGLIQNIDLAFNSEKQSITWSGREQLGSFIHGCDLLVSNDESEIHVDLSGSVEAHLTFLKSVVLPVYHRNLWDVLKFDQITNMDDLEFLNFSTSVVYTKSAEGQEYAIPSKFLRNAVVFSIPEISIAVPSWIKEIPSSWKDTDMEFENPDVPDPLILPPVVSVPAFDVPFTNLHVEPFTIDPKNLRVPKEVTTTAFEIMLPGLPVMRVPSFHINTEHLRGKMSFLSLKMPQYDIVVSSFTLPKSFGIGEQTINLNDITSYISNFELPTIEIPEQKIEIPEIDLHLPSSVFIPAFGALGATLKLSSPIYNVSTTAKIEKKDSSLVTSINSICTSTVILLEYDLSGSAAFELDDGVFSLHGKCKLVHNDVNVDWQHVFAQNLRMKRQTSVPDTMVSHHTLSVDITSPTFVDVSLRYASRKDGITASMSAPSCGFLGLLVQRRSPSQLYGKMFSRYLSTPERDADIFTAKATLKNSQKLNLQTSWNFEVLHDMIEGTKDRVPAVSDAVLRFINKYHTAHFGFDVNRGGMKMKSAISNIIEKTYHEVPLTFSSLQTSIEHLSHEGRRVSDGLLSLTLGGAVHSLNVGGEEVLNRTEESMNKWLDAVASAFYHTAFPVPGSEDQISGQVLSTRVQEFLSRVSNRAKQRLDSLREEVSNHIRRIEFTVPGTEVVVNGNEVMHKLERAWTSVADQVKYSVHRWFDLLCHAVYKNFQVFVQEGDKFISYLKDENRGIAAQVDAIHAEILQASRQNTAEAERRVAKFKDLSKRRVQDVYSSMSIERINNETKEVISILQSHLYGGLHECVDVVRQASQSAAPYLKMSDKKMDVEIPLPFFWNSFSEWPTQTRH